MGIKDAVQKMESQTGYIFVEGKKVKLGLKKTSYKRGSSTAKLKKVLDKASKENIFYNTI
jgi:hypothetical protein